MTTRKAPRRRFPSQNRRGPLPKGAGRVNCLVCGATAAADGKGSPIMLPHAPDCPEAQPETPKPWLAHCYICECYPHFATETEAMAWKREHWDSHGHHTDHALAGGGQWR